MFLQSIQCTNNKEPFKRVCACAYPLSKTKYGSVCCAVHPNNNACTAFVCCCGLVPSHFNHTLQDYIAHTIVPLLMKQSLTIWVDESHGSTDDMTTSEQITKTGKGCIYILYKIYFKRFQQYILMTQTRDFEEACLLTVSIDRKSHSAGNTKLSVFKATFGVSELN